MSDDPLRGDRLALDNLRLALIGAAQRLAELAAQLVGVAGAGAATPQELDAIVAGAQSIAEALQSNAPTT